MDATTRQIARPRQLARELAASVAHLRETALAEPDAARALLEHLLPSGDDGPRSALRRRIANDPLEQAEVAAQLLVFRLLAQAGGGDDGDPSPDAEGVEASFVPSVRELAALTRGCDLAEVVQTMSRAYRPIDPLAQLHELLLRECDARLRRRRGVFYTPAPVVRWIVRSVKLLLHSHFEPPTHVRFVDPACGSGTFLAGVIEQFSGLRGASFAPMPYAPSLVGFDVLPATCAVAMTLLGRQLEGSRGTAPFHAPYAKEEKPENQTACKPALRVECANPLIEGEALAPLVLGTCGDLPVILGNPPYANFGRQNRGTWIRELLADYKAGLGERKLNLDDDFIKFFRWGQYWIERAGRGVLALVTSRTYLDGLTHRAMRASLCRAFDEIFVLDLGGDVDKLRGAASRAADENVFGIRRGVAIGVFVKGGRGSCRAAAARVYYHALRGTREEKFAALDATDVETTAWQAVSPAPPDHGFAPRARRRPEYRTWPRLDEIFTQYISGVQTKNDAILTDLSRERLAARMAAVLENRGIADAQDEAAVNLARAKLSRRKVGVRFQHELLRPYLAGPLDVQWIYYEPRLLGRARWTTMRHMLRANIALVFMRQSTCEGQYDHFLATDALASDRAFYSTHGAPFVAPLWLYDDEGEEDCDNGESDESKNVLAPRRPNLEPAFAAEFAARLKLRYRPLPDGDEEHAGDPSSTLRPEDIFHHAYGVCFSRDYRRRYGDELRVDFPRLPPIDDVAGFRCLCERGRRLCELHVSGPPRFRVPPGSHDPPAVLADGWHIAPGYPRYVPETAAQKNPPHRLEVDPGVRGGLLLNRGLLLSGIAVDVWSYRLGGCEVLPRWLRRRRGEKLSPGQRESLLRLIETIAQTIRLTD